MPAFEQHDTHSRSSTWSLNQFALVRSTGFPVELMGALACPQTAALLDAKPPDEDTEAAFAGELDAMLARLGEIAGAEDVQEALFLSSPSACASLREPVTMPLRKHERQVLRRLALYLQRFATKCDTNSFFGPAWWGGVGQAPELLAFAAPEQFAIARRHVCWTHWAVSSFAAAIAADSAVCERLPVRPAPGATMELSTAPATGEAGGTAWLTNFAATPPKTGEPISLSPDEAAIFAAARETGGEYTTAELCAGDEGRRLALERLIARGLLRRDLEIPSGLAEPLAWLARYVEALPEPDRMRWQPLLAEAEAARARYEAGNLACRQRESARLAETFEQVCATPAARGAGTFYSDRWLLFEEAQRDWRQCDLGEPFTATIANDVLPTVYVLMDIECLRHRLRQEVVARWLAETFAGEETVPLPRMLARAERDPALAEALGAVEQEVRPRAEELTRWLCAGNTEQRHAAIAREAMRARATSVEMLPCVVNPDLMLAASSPAAANRGDGYWVLGELHTGQDLLAHNSLVPLHPDQAGARAAMAREYARIVPGVTVAEPVMEHTDKTKVVLPHALPQIEFSGRALDCLPGDGDTSPIRLRAGELFVRWEGGHPQLYAPGIGPVLLTRTPVWAPYNRTSVLNVFALPHCNRFEGQIFRYPDGCDHFPRVTMGALVLHRETWWVRPRPDWQIKSGYSLALWREVRMWAERAGLPERVFVRFSDEPKPVFVDMRSPVLVHWLAGKLATARRPAQVTEFLPDVDHLWLRDARGHYCCEFRVTMYLDGGPLDGPPRSWEART